MRATAPPHKSHTHRNIVKFSGAPCWACFFALLVLLLLHLATCFGPPLISARPLSRLLALTLNAADIAAIGELQFETKTQSRGERTCGVCREWRSCAFPGAEPAYPPSHSLQPQSPLRRSVRRARASSASASVMEYFDSQSALKTNEPFINKFHV